MGEVTNTNGAKLRVSTFKKRGARFLTLTTGVFMIWGGRKTGAFHRSGLLQTQTASERKALEGGRITDGAYGE